jgi:ssDNA-binding Zn-finger/Zn-ribbon topoisomerase 1
VSSKRDVVDYGLQRRALLAELASGRRTPAEACDAHPHLLLAARHYGTPTATACPVCAKRRQQHEFDVYVVEVCPDCGWNHLIRSFILGRPADSSLTAADG